jgi:virulence-associated protein VapD
MFDLDQDTLGRLDYGLSLDDAYSDIRCFLTSQGFEWMQGSTYFGDATINAVNCVTTVQKLARKFDWFAPAVNDIRMLRIEDNNDLSPAIELAMQMKAR